MADIAASLGVDITAADLALGEDIAERYAGLWHEVTRDEVIGTGEQWRITERIERLNGLGFEVGDLKLIPESGGARLRMQLHVGGRTFHANRLRELTGVEATEHQARQILSDLRYFEATHRLESAAAKHLAAITWRAEVFEPLLQRIRRLPDRHVSDPVQSFCDLLHHRYLLSAGSERDVPTDEALERWIEAGQPGYPLD
jgi:hypothetical protein